MSDLTEFLLQRIAEDEEAAKNAALSAGGVGYGDERIANGKTWSSSYHEVVRPVVPDVSDRRTVADCGGFVGLDIAPHVARHDPARVLRECEAKRKIIAFHAHDDFEPQQDSDQFQRMTQEEYRARSGGDLPIAPMLRVLAAVYVDHPDFDPAWA